MEEVMRLDKYLVKEGHVSSRAKASKLILDGVVSCNGKICTSVSQEISPSDRVTVQRGAAPTFVSQGGLKLLWAIEQFGVDFRGTCVVDLGASTGGFTDCILQHGARFVHAIDVGTEQMDANLRRLPNVESRENVDVRSEHGELEVDHILCDLSFISIQKILGNIAALLPAHGSCICLIKPQFEAGKGRVNSKGIITDRAMQTQVLQEVIRSAAENGMVTVGATYSPLGGAGRNTEYLLLFRRTGMAMTGRIEMLTQRAAELLA